MFDKLTIILLVAGIVLSGGGYLVYSKMKGDIKLLEEQNTTLKIVNATNVETLYKERLNSKRQVENILSLKTELSEAEAYLDELQSLFQDHDLTRLAEEKPGLIERRINDGTQNVFDNIEQFTGSR